MGLVVLLIGHTLTTEVVKTDAPKLAAQLSEVDATAFSLSRAKLLSVWLRETHLGSFGQIANCPPDEAYKKYCVSYQQAVEI